MSMRVKGDGKPGAATSGTPGLGGRVQATCFPQGRITRCALTSPILASAVTRRQDLEAYVAVLYAAIRKHGCPEVLVSDSGSVFLDHKARQIYKALGIEKQEIEKRQSWQNYIEPCLYVTWNYPLW
jgi:transposase InsO family protein